MISHALQSPPHPSRSTPAGRPIAASPHPAPPLPGPSRPLRSNPRPIHRRACLRGRARGSTIRSRAVAAPPRPIGSPRTLDDVELHPLDASSEASFDLVIAGAGPSGLAVADRVSRAGFRVCIVDPEPRSWWPNNYGVWVDEFEAMGLADCLEVVWPKAKVFLHDGEDGERFLNRPYARVDRPKLKRKFLERCLKQGVRFHVTKVEDIMHDDYRSEVKCSDGSVLETTLVLDATGHARKLIQFDKKFDPGYQAAYGLLAEVESHPFDLDTMVFMDWRDAHTENRPDMRDRNKKDPTFMYAMPFSEKLIFLEETSLVARPPIAFDELKKRFEARVESLGIKITRVEEEEYCLIPMGSALPQKPQRVLGIGGTAGMVHPSTGYMISRMLGVVPTLADTIVDELSTRQKDSEQNGSLQEVTGLAERVWQKLWPVERVRQRDFFCFGMEVTLQLDLQQTREFFGAFFSLSEFHWHGFLSARLSFSELLVFGLSLFANSTNEARINLLQKGAPGLAVLLANLAKTLGD
ncbi:unnamed protein product [Ostreobium quekettii]|uniref:lycopene beta-cyclase n=1 Tax=Ostreobium quekettii TaxID=121088 RepID=A0A8S1J605_9CHLO|nr:unnamed protein product [Ostreobium quekettii]